MNEKTLVVAHYQEDLSWISKVGREWRVVVYSKGGQNFSGSCFSSAIALPNVGREAHTYLTHIIREWDSLSPVTVFAQGDPFDHCPDFLDRLAGVTQSQGVTFESWGNHEIVFDSRGYPHLQQTAETLKGARLSAYFQQLFDVECPPLLHVRANAIFLVTREQVRTRSRSFYERIRSTTEHANNPIEIHYLERLWPAVFVGPRVVELTGVDDLPLEWSAPEARRHAQHLLKAWEVLRERGDENLALAALIQVNELIDKERPYLSVSSAQTPD